MQDAKSVIAVIGAGAVGAYYGGRLAQHGEQVHFLLRSEYEQVKSGGWEIRSKDGDFHLPPAQINVYREARGMPKADLIVVTLKATANDRLGALLELIVKENTTILTLQNGLGNEEKLAELFGAERVMGGLAFVCINRLSPGVVHHIDHGLIRVGDFTEGRRDRVETIVNLFNRCGIPCNALPSLKYGRWEKLAWNIPFNGLGAACDLTTDQIINDAEGVAMVRRIILEVMAVARKLGVELPADMPEQKIQQTQTMGAYKSSMQLDREMNRPMEVEAILGEPVRVARRLGVETPAMEMLYRMVRLVDRRQ